MKSIHFIISNATTIFTNPFTSFFHFSHSHAEITLNHVTTVMMMAKKNAKALIADKTTKSTFHIRESVNQPIPCVSLVVNELALLNCNTSQNNQFDA